jgi:hypothetical protein
VKILYDKDNNPILSMGGDIDKLIAKYDKLIKKQQEALNQEYKDQQRNATDKMNEGQGFAGKDGAFNKQAIKEYNRQIENIRKKKTELNNTFTQTGDSAWLEDYSERLAKLSDTYASAKEAVVDAEAKISTESQKINKSIVNSLSIGDGFSRLKSDVQSEMIEVINGLDFSQLTSGQQSLFESNMKKMFDSGTIDKSIRKLYDLQQAYADTSDITAYEQGIEKLIPSLAKLWGVNEDVARSMVELPESAKMAQNAMDAYLRSFGKNINMTDKETKDLMATWDAYNNFLQDLSGLDTVEKDGKMVYNIKEVKATLEDSNLPDKVKDLVNRLMDDNEFSLDDMELTAKLSQIYVEDDEETRNNLIQDVQNLVDKQFGKGKIDVGKLFVTGEYAVSDDDKKKIDDAFASFKQFDGKDEIVKTLRTQVENTDQVENYAKLMDNLRGKDKDIETFFKNNIQDLSKLESYEDMIQWVFDHPEAVTKCHINVLGEDTIKTAKAEIDSLLNEKDEKDIKVKIDKALAQGDIATVMDLIGQLPAEKQIEVGVALSNALDELGTVDAIQLKNKVVDVTVMAFQALQQLYALQGLKIPEKYIKIISNSADVASKLDSLKQQIKEIPRSISIMATLTYTEKGKSKVPHSGKGKSVMWGDSIGEFSNIEDNPYSVEQLSATPMVTSQPVVTANDVNTATSTSDSSGGISTYATRDFNSIGDIETALTPISLKYQDVLDMIEYSVELFKELQYRIETVTKKTSLLDKQMEKAIGTEKIKYLEQKNKLLEEQAKLQKEYYDDLISERDTLQQKLQKEGFNFNEDGNMTNYEEKLLAMQKEYKRLQDIADKASKNSSSKSSSNSSASQSASDKASKYKEELDKLTNLANKYYDIQQSELFSCEEQWSEMKATIKENNDEIEKLTREDKLYRFNNAITKINNQFDILGNKIDIIDVKLENSNGLDTIKLTEEKLKLMNEQLSKQMDLINNMKNKIPVYQENLSKYGFTFDIEGNVNNIDDILNSFQNNEDLEKVNDLLEEYTDLINGDLADAEKKYADLQKDIVDLQKDKLNKVKDIEDKITDVIKDEIDKRKDSIEKQYDKEKELIEKKRDAYKKQRDEDDYAKDLKEQQDKIDEINKKIELAKKDNSMSGKSKLKELLDELKEAQDDLNDKIQSKTDSDIDDMFQSQLDALDKKKEDMTQDIDDTYTQQKIAQMVQDAMMTNTFTDLNGNITNLQDKLIDFAETSGDAVGILGDSIKTELCDNLSVALDYLKDYSEIFDQLGFKQLGNISYKDNLNKNTGNKTLNVGDIVINIDGNVDDNTLDDMQDMINKTLQDIVNKSL